MLKNRTIIILAAVLVVLVLISIMQKRSHQQATTRPSTVELVPATTDPEAIDSIHVGHGAAAEALVLQRSPAGWIVASAWDARANAGRVDALLTSLVGLSGEFRSDSGEVVADYGFSDSTTVTVMALDAAGSQIFNLEIGDKAEGAVGNFVKLPGENAVYLSRTSVLNNLGLYSGPGRPEAKHFLDLQAFKVDRQDVEGIVLSDFLSDGDQVLAMHKEFTIPEPAPDDTTGAVPAIDRNVYEWKISTPQRKAAAKSKADGVQSALSSLRATDIADPRGAPEIYGFAQPSRTVTLELRDGATTTMTFGAVREAVDDQPAGVYLRIDDDPTVWIVGEYVLNNIFKSYEDLLPEDD